MAQRVMAAAVPGVSAQVQAIAFRELAALLNAGVPINLALEQASHTGPAHFRSALMDLAQTAANGSSVAERMRDYGSLFSPVVPAMVHASELSGNYAWSFGLLADFFEAEAELKRTITNALIYPGCVMLTAIGAAAVLAFIGFMSTGILHGLLWTVGIIAALWIAMRFRFMQRLARYFVMLLPFFGNIMQQLSVARFCRTFGLLVKAGVPYLEGLESSQAVADHPLVRRGVEHVYYGVRNGATVEDSIRRQGVFPPLVHNLVGSGEASGSLDEALLKAAQFLHDDASYKIKNSAKVAGPVLIIAMAVIVVLIGISFLQGYFDMLWGILEE